MDAAEREALVNRLALAFGDAKDVTPAEVQPLHVLLRAVDLPEPWKPATTRVLTIWTDWPSVRPQFLIDESVVGEGGEPPRSNSSIYAVGETWRGFSFEFPWSGDDPVHAVQLWMARFTAEPS